MARQEVIDGPGVAAKILSRFPARERDHVVAAIRSEAPKVAATLERRMGEIVRAERLSIKELTSSPSPAYASDVASSPRTPPPAVTQPTLERVYETVVPQTTQQSVQQVEKIIDSPLPEPVTDIEAAQNRILRRLEELYPDASQGGERKPFKSRLA